MKIEKINVDIVKPYPRNPRVNQQTVDFLVESIRQYGFNVPVTLDKEDTIITGHTRYKAVCKLRGQLYERVQELREEGKDELADNLQAINDGYIFVVHNNDLTEEQIKEYRIADNKIGELSTWDETTLKAELRELDTIIGFTSEELDRILDNPITFDKIDEEKIEEVKEEMEHKYEEIASQDELVEVVCPYCKETFSVKPEEVATDLKWKKLNKEAMEGIET